MPYGIRRWLWLPVNGYVGRKKTGPKWSLMLNCSYIKNKTVLAQKHMGR